MRTWLILLSALAFTACSGDGSKDGSGDSAATSDSGSTTGDDDDTTTDPVQAILALTGDSSAGMALYDTNCAGCHAADGSGGTGPSLLRAISAESIVEKIYYGEDSMPAFGDTLSEQEIADITAYVEGFAQ